MKRSSIVIPAFLYSFAVLPSVGISQTAPAAPAAGMSQTPTQQKPTTQAPNQTTPAFTPRQSAPVSGGGPKGPEAIAQQDPDRVVANIAGKPVTAKQALDLLHAVQPEDRKRNEGKLSELVRQIYMEDATAAEAVRLKLDQQSPWKEQLRISRDNILTQAYITQTASAGGTSEDPKAYYDAHSGEFDQIKLSGILVAFNPPGTPASSSAVQRTEADAQIKATEIEKKIKAGGDFSALARTDSDNQQSSARGGEIGTFVMADPNLPPNVKELVAKMQPQQVAEPFRVPGGFYIFKLDSRTKVPFEQARPSIVQKQQADKTQALLKQTMDKYSIQVQDPDFFASSNPAAASAPKIPSLQRPAGTQPAPQKP